jgi:hypothetical protein
MIKPLFLAVLATVALAGCGRSGDTQKPAAPPSAPASAPNPAPASTPAAPAASASALSEAEQAKAVDIARAAIEKYKLTSLSTDCLSFMASQEDDMHYNVEVLENHTPACGGDPNTAPHVVTLLIDKSTGALQKDDPASGEYVPLK